MENLAQIVFDHYYLDMGEAFTENPDQLANDLCRQGVIRKREMENVQVLHDPDKKAHSLLMALLMAVDLGGLHDDSDKTLRIVCRIMSKHDNLKQLSHQMMKRYGQLL